MLLEEEEALHALMVLEKKELEALGKWYKKMVLAIKFGRLDLLLEVQQSMSLADFWAPSKEVPRRHGSIHELSRPMVRDSGALQQFLVVTSTAQDRESGLGAKISCMMMSEEGSPLTSFTAASRPTLPWLFTVQLGSGWVRLGMARMVYHCMEDDELTGQPCLRHAILRFDEVH